jgi:hypothetical protein
MGVISTQGFKFKLVANGTQLDLFKDEDIKLSDNVTGLFDLGVLPADFTRQLTVPGTKKNNAFFEHVYDISVFSPDLFATNQKVPAYFDFDGIYLAQGYLQLNKVNVIANKFIDSYEITIFGALSSFAREINRVFLTDMTGSLSQYNHTSSLTAISSSWNGELFNGDIVYPLAEYGQRITYTPEEAYFGIDSTDGALCVQDFKPSIRVKAVWDAIFEQYGYTYSGSFWEQSWLNNVYMVCNNKLRYPVYAEEELETYGQFKTAPVSGSTTNFTLTNNTPAFLPWYNIQFNPSANLASDLTFTLDYETALRGVINLNIKLTNAGAGNGIPVFRIYVKDLSGTTVSQTVLVNFNRFFEQIRTADISQGLSTATSKYTLQTEFVTGQMAAGQYKFYIEYSANYASNFFVTVDPDNELKSSLEITKQTRLGNGWVMNVGANMPFGTTGIKQIDFIRGLQKKFNLVIYPSKTKQNEFIVETFNNWYNKGTVKNFNRYINLDERIEVIPANNFAVNELNFGDTLDGDYISQQFAKGANREYGKQYYVDTNNFFSQGKFEVKTSLASSPIIYLAGTGVSGSSTAGTPLIGAGYVKILVPGPEPTFCDNYEEYYVYTTTGTIVTGSTLYLDAYGNNKFVGYSNILVVTGPNFWTGYYISEITAIVGPTDGSSCIY